MNTTSGVLAIIDEPVLRDDVDRVTAAAGVGAVHVSDPSSRRVWAAAPAVLLDVTAARRCADRSLPRRSRVVLVCRDDPSPEAFQTAIAVGAQHVLALPQQEAELVAQLSELVEEAMGGGDGAARGPVIAVLGARGGSGASVFATALARCAGTALLVDVDAHSGGIDLVLGTERESGLRWPDLALAGGRVSSTGLRDALPGRDGVSVLSSGRSISDIDPNALSAVLDAGRRGGQVVVCDLPRPCTPAAEAALDLADLVVLCVPADVRSCAAAGALAPWLSAINPNVGLVVRGPSPGGLGAGDIARLVGLPLLARMRAQPRIAEDLERGGLRLPTRSPLASAARRVLTVLQQHPATEAA